MVHPALECNDFGEADYYLAYGRGIKTRANPVVPATARFISVGSASLETRRVKALSAQPVTADNILEVLWISETLYGNTKTQTLMSEDTRRYLLVKRCLKVLGRASDVRVTYRPTPGPVEQQAGIIRWLEREKLLGVCVDDHTDLDELLGQCDVVVTDRHCNTVWNEAIVFQKPLIVYCDPSQTPLMKHFMSDIDQSCYWCKTEKELAVAVERLVSEGSRFVRELSEIDTTSYLEKYVVHRDDGQCIPRVISFLNTVCRYNHDVGDWESAVQANTVKASSNA